MEELFAARNMTSPWVNRSDLLAGNTLTSAPVSIRNCCLEFLPKSRRRREVPVAWAAFTDWRSSFPTAVETYKVCGIL